MIYQKESRLEKIQASPAPRSTICATEPRRLTAKDLVDGLNDDSSPAATLPLEDGVEDFLEYFNTILYSLDDSAPSEPPE